MSRMVAIVVAAALAGGLAGGAIGKLLGDDTSPGTTAETAALPLTRPVGSTLAPPAARSALAPARIYAGDAPGVVVITDTQTEVVPPTFFTPPQKHQIGALGSGFVIDTRGDIVTNEHVVQQASKIRIGFSTGVTYPGRIIGSDPSTDIAVVRVDAPESVLHPLVFDDSDTVRVGEPAYAIGNPFGLDRTMTAGIVSATGRDIQAPNGFTIANAIQTDAPINHGNSGGPLLNRFGRVIGVNAQIQGGTVTANVGIGFAVPSSTAESVAQRLISSGHAEHPWLGVQIDTIDPTVARVVRGLPAHGVVVVKVVKGSPAAKAGLQAATRRVLVNGVDGFTGGDSIVAVDGHPVTTSAELSNAIARHRTGDRITLEVVRDGVRRTIELTLGNVPA